MKPLNKKNYGSIPHLLGSKLGGTDKYIHEGQHKILTEKTRDKHDFVIVTEKYDGSNVGIARINGKILALTRSSYLAETSPYKQHHVFAKWVAKNKKRFKFIRDGERLVGEWLLQVHSLKYDILDEPLVLFDYFDINNKRYSYREFALTFMNDFQLPRIIHCDYSAISIEKAMDILSHSDCRIMTDSPEGVVYRIERKREEFDFMAKYVRPDFEPGKYCINVDECDLQWNYKFDM